MFVREWNGREELLLLHTTPSTCAVHSVDSLLTLCCVHRGSLPLLLFHPVGVKCHTNYCEQLWTTNSPEGSFVFLCLLSVELQDWREIEASFVSWDRTHKPTTEVPVLCTRRLRMGSPYVQVKETNALILIVLQPWWTSTRSWSSHTKPSEKFLRIHPKESIWTTSGFNNIHQVSEIENLESLDWL